jgi:hypothetical protein
VSDPGEPLRLTVFGQTVWVRSEIQDLLDLVRVDFAGMLSDDADGPEATLVYELGPGPDEASCQVARAGRAPVPVAGPGELLFQLEKDLTIELQRLRKDLFFLHAAALEREGRVLLLVADSGAGKSTTTWALCHHGLRYLSDELAPLDLDRRRVLAYPHALCLKDDPPASHPLPHSVIVTETTLHVPVSDLPGGVGDGGRLHALVFLGERLPPDAAPQIAPMGSAEAAARLLKGALNPLAHAAAGLDAALDIASAARCTSVRVGELTASCAEIARLLDPVEA